MSVRLSAREKRAIADLQDVARRWPRTLWLFSASGSLNVMRKGPDGEHVTVAGGGMDQRYSVGHITGIDNDGGDW